MRGQQKHKEKKRHGLHQKHSTKNFMKVYWPYLPAALVLLLTFSLIIVQPFKDPSHVLSYSTNVSEEGLLQSTNEHRKRNGSPELTINENLSKAAEIKARDMVLNNYWSHTAPSGMEPWQFLDKVGYSYLKAGENLAFGFSESSRAVAGWMNSESHRLNMLDKAFTEVGFGTANSPDFQGKGAQTVIVAFYGQPVSASTDLAVNPRQNLTSKNFVESSSKNVAWVESATDGKFPWIMYLVGAVTGASITVLMLRHSIKFVHLLRKSEKFILHHPVIDTALFIVALIGIALSQNIGFIR